MKNKVFFFSIIFGIIFIGTSAKAADSLFTISANNISLTVNVNAGARVVSFKVDEKELLSSNKVHRQFYGSSLWLSPEGKWKGMGKLDRAPYIIEKTSKNELRYSSQQDTSGFTMSKDFRTGNDTSIAITYTITNIASYAQSVSPWEVTRVPTGGLALFQKGPQPILAKSNLKIFDSAGVIWYPYDSVKAGHQKLFTSGSEGWTAYIKDGFIFIKKYPIVPSAEVAPREENVEIYVNPDKTYMELENQGHFKELKTNESLTYEVKWYARRLAQTIDTNVGSKEIVNYVRSIVLK